MAPNDFAYHKIMQVKIFTIPVLGGEAFSEEMNAFLRSQKILQIESSLIQQPQGSYWSFCVRYVAQVTKPAGRVEKTDYKHTLDTASFERFKRLREIRRSLAKEEEVPAYVIFTNDELSKLAVIEDLTLAAMKKVKGVGPKKIEKYGQHFISSPDEKSQSSAAKDQ